MLHEQQNMATLLWTWPELALALDNPPKPGPHVLRIQTDSRSVRPGDFFIALPGDPGPRFNPGYRSTIDGHDFVEDAANKGAVGAMVHADTHDTIPTLRVENTYGGLWTLGRAASERMGGTRIAITGSNGKTTAKSFLASALNAYSAPGSFNNHIGVPVSLANMPKESAFGVFEVGTNHEGEIAPLAELIQPHVAIVLNVGNAHIENFPNSEALFKEKITIFNHLYNKSNAIWHESIGQKFGRSFGLRAGTDAQLLDLAGDRATYRLFGNNVSARVPGGGEHRALTLAAVLLATVLSEGDLRRALELRPELVPKGRGNEIQVGGVTIVDDSYNANPASVNAAIQSLAGHHQTGRTIAVVGEMLELGDASEGEHQQVVQILAQVDSAVCVGDAFKGAAHKARVPWFANAGDALETVALMLVPGDRILIKGSNKVFWQNSFVEALIQRLS